METGNDGFDEQIDLSKVPALKRPVARLPIALTIPTPERIYYIADAFRIGMSVDDVFKLTKIDPWFLVQIEDIVKTEAQVKALGFGGLTEKELTQL